MKTSEFFKSIERKPLFDNTSRRWIGRLSKMVSAALIAGSLTGVCPFDSGTFSSAQAQTWVVKTATAPENLTTAGNYLYTNRVTVNSNAPITFGEGVLAVYSAGLASTPPGSVYTFATSGAGTLMVLGDSTSLSGLSNRRFRVESTLNLGGEYTKDGTTYAGNAQFADLANIGIDGGTVNYYAKDGTTVTYNGRITLGNSQNQSGKFNKTGAGTLVLTRAGEKEPQTGWNAPIAFAGAYNIQAGTLQLNDCFLPGAATISTNAALVYNITDGKSYTNTGSFAGDGTLKKTGAGTLVVSGIGGLNGANAAVVVDQGVLEVKSNNALNISSSLSGAGTLRKTGTGALTVNITKSVAGNIDLQGGSLIINNGNITSFTSSVNVGAGTIADFQVSLNNIYAFTGSLSGSGTIQKEWLGTLVFRTSNVAGSGDSSQFTGTWNVAGTLQVGNKENAMPVLGGNVVLQAKNGSYPDKPSTLHFSTKEGTTTTFAGTITEISGAGGVLKKSENGTVVLSGGPNTYTGGTIIEGGTLALSNNASLGTGNITFSNNSTLRSSGTTTIDGKLTGAGKLVVTGGKLTLNNENTNTGGTVIEAGTLLLTKSKSENPMLGVTALSAPVSIYKDGVLEMNGVKITGNVGSSPNDYSVYGGTILNSSVDQYVGLRGLKLYGAQVNGQTSGTAPDLGRFLLSGTISAFAPKEVTIPSTGVKYTTGAVSSINADSVEVGFTHGEVTFSVAENATLEVNASIIQNNEHSGNVKKTGKGTLVFSKENTYKQATTLSEGILKLTDSGTLGVGTVTVSCDLDKQQFSELIIAREGTITNAMTLGGEGINRSGAVHFSKDATISGDLTLSTHTGFGADEGVTGTLSGKITNPAGQVFAWYGKGDLRLTGDLSALDSNIIRSDGGHLILTSQAIATLATSQVLTANTGGIGVDVASGQYALANRIIGAGSFAKYGDGELLYGNTGSNYQGGTYVYAGTLTLNTTNLPTGAETVKYPLYVYDGAKLKVTANGAFGNGSSHPSSANLYGGTLENNSTSHLTMTRVNMYGGTMESTAASTSAYGDFLIDDQIRAYYTAPDGKVYNNGVSEINADSLGFYYRNTSDRYVFVDDKATLVINSDIHKKTGQQYNTVDLEKRGNGLLVLNGAVDTKVSITGGGLLLESGAVLNDTLTTATGTTVQLGGTINAAANINGDWYIDPESVNDVLLKSALTLADTSELLFPTENLSRDWDYDIILGTGGSINGLTDSSDVAQFLTERMTAGSSNFWTIGIDGGNIVAYVDAGKVPEPSSLILFGIGLLGLYLYRRRK